MGVRALTDTGMSLASLVFRARVTVITHGPPASCRADTKCTWLTASTVGARRGLLAMESVSTTSPPTPALPSAPGGVQRITQMSLPCMPLVLDARTPNANHGAGDEKVRLMFVARGDGTSHEMSTRPTDRRRYCGEGAGDTLGDTLGDRVGEALVDTLGEMPSTEKSRNALDRLLDP